MDGASSWRFFVELPRGAEDCLFVELLCVAWVELLGGAAVSFSWEQESDSCELKLPERGDCDIHTSVRCLATLLTRQEPWQDERT